MNLKIAYEQQLYIKSYLSHTFEIVVVHVPDDRHNFYDNYIKYTSLSCFWYLTKMNFPDSLEDVLLKLMIEDYEFEKRK